VFATLVGGLPRPPLLESATTAELVAAVVAAQEDAGLEPLVDGGLWGSTDVSTVVERWRATSELTDRVVKAVVDGPYSAGTDPATTNAVLRELEEAGCRLVEVHEPSVIAIGADPDARQAFVAAQQRILERVSMHASLAIVGGNADAAGVDTLLAAPYASLTLDLVRGPDNWRLATAASRTTGIVCGALTADPSGDESVEILLYALNYAASTGGRGPDRVGLATAGSLAALPWEVAERRMRRLAEAVRVAGARPDERAAALDPRAVNARSAALGTSELPRGASKARREDATAGLE
jgi:methionine synthase II (cobalamin-independent)